MTGRQWGTVRQLGSGRQWGTRRQQETKRQWMTRRYHGHPNWRGNSGGSRGGLQYDRGKFNADFFPFSIVYLIPILAVDFLLC